MVLRPTLTLPRWLRCVSCHTCHSRCQRALRGRWHPEAGQERPGYAYTTVGEAAGAAAGHCRRNRGFDTAERIIAVIVPMSRLRAYHRLETINQFISRYIPIWSTPFAVYLQIDAKDWPRAFQRQVSNHVLQLRPLVACAPKVLPHCLQKP